MREAICKLKDRRTQGQHPLLILNRFVCEKAVGDEGNAQEKRDLLEAARTAAIRLNGKDSIYRLAFERWQSFISQQASTQATRCFELQTAGRLIIGLGIENVIEAGIRLHQLYGMPIIPGSALKGLAAHYCAQIWGKTDKRFDRPSAAEDEQYAAFLAGKGEPPPENFHRLLFGSIPDGGCVVFHDAWYIPESASSPLVLDVMTPHHLKWNDVDHPQPPTDFDDPQPVPFLAVTGRFLFAITWQGPKVDSAAAWLSRTEELLREALREWGIGGKTTSGYGRLCEPVSGGLAPPKPAVAVELPNAGDIVEATLLEEKTKKGGWKARHNATGIDGPIVNSADVPPDKKPGDVILLEVSAPTPKQISFRYNPEAKEPRKKPPVKSKRR